MSGSDGEFDDFLSRRKPVFRRTEQDPLEPPPELDRIVLRRAREAIESDRPEPLYHGPRWGMPVALAATILVALTVILHVGMQSGERVPEVTVQNVARDLEMPATATSGATSDSETPVTATASAPPPGKSVIADLNPSRLARDNLPGVSKGFVSEEEATRYAPAPPPPLASTAAPATMDTASAPAAGEAQRVAGSGPTPAWRSDETTWQAEIQRLRAAGKTAEADLEQAEYNRQHRAYAGAPDR